MSDLILDVSDLILDELNIILQLVLLLWKATTYVLPMEAVVVLFKHLYERN